jgi:hypothetical protein
MFRNIPPPRSTFNVFVYHPQQYFNSDLFMKFYIFFLTWKLVQILTLGFLRLVFLALRAYIVPSGKHRLVQVKYASTIFDLSVLVTESLSISLILINLLVSTGDNSDKKSRPCVNLLSTFPIDRLRSTLQFSSS